MIAGFPENLAKWSTEESWTVDASASRVPYLNAEAGPPRTTFHFSKANAWDAWHIFEKIRLRVFESTAGDSKDLGRQFLTAIGSLPPVFVAEIAADLFQFVTYENWTNTGNPMHVAGNEASAFEGLEPSAVYQVVGRSIAVNFTESLAGVISRMSEFVQQDSNL